MNKLFINLLAFIVAVILSYVLFFFSKTSIEKNIMLSSFMEESITKSEELKIDLESGKIVIFGSSELTHNDQKFIPQNYFNKELHLPLRVQGHAGAQCFVIMSQLAALNNKDLRRDARVVIFLSPGWFSKYSEGTSVPLFLEYMYSGMMYRLFFESDIEDKYKKLVGDYIFSHHTDFKNLTYLYKYGMQYSLDIATVNPLNKLINKSLKKQLTIKSTNYSLVQYKMPFLNYTKLKEEAKKVSKPSTTNNWGINDDYYTKYVLPKIQKDKFPYDIETPSSLSKNQEYQDFLNLVELLKAYKIKPLFIMQDLHPYVYVENRDSMNPILSSIKEVLEENEYGYLDMWSYTKEEYEMGTLTDIMHTGELGWVKINQKIIEHFMR